MIRPTTRRAPSPLAACLLAALTAALVLASPRAYAQPTVTAVTPAANARAVSRTTPVTATFDQALTPASAAALKVYSAQRGGLRTAAAPAVVRGNTLTYTPRDYPFLPGETVTSVITPAAASSSGALAHGTVVQFTAATGGAGRGNFAPSGNANTVFGNRDVLVSDVDGDGDLDLVCQSIDNTVTIQLNGGDATGSNTGLFRYGTPVNVGRFIKSQALGDVDGDGDVDLLVASYNSLTLAEDQLGVYLNGGDATGSNTGVFALGSSVRMPYDATFGLAVGDVDGDGDLDVLATNSTDGNVGVYLNGGDATGSHTGVFAGPRAVPVGLSPNSVALGDVDGDGDLDIVTGSGSNTAGAISIRLNGGDATGSNTGAFGNGSDIPLAATTKSVALGDVDGDGDLDVLAAIFNLGRGTTVAVRLNGGDATGSHTGVFSNGSDVPVGNGPARLVLGDIDGDGDLDLLTANSGPGGMGGLSNTVSIRLNGGDATGSSTGTFRGSDLNAGVGPLSLALGDVDGDGDVDLCATFAAGLSATKVFLNANDGQVLAGRAPAPPAAGALVVAPTVGTGDAPRYAYAGPAVAAGATLGLYALTGQRVWEQPVAAATGVLPVAGLASGWYLVRLRTAGAQFTARFFQP
ncbi:MAG: FG-GAP-like repeat-containing protein [Janthinobacterium lividum]